jgi:hypothetical protein
MIFVHLFAKKDHLKLMIQDRSGSGSVLGGEADCDADGDPDPRTILVYANFLFAT